MSEGPRSAGPDIRPSWRTRRGTGGRHRRPATKRGTERADRATPPTRVSDGCGSRVVSAGPQGPPPRLTAHTVAERAIAPGRHPTRTARADRSSAPRRHGRLAGDLQRPAGDPGDLDQPGRHWPNTTCPPRSSGLGPSSPASRQDGKTPQGHPSDRHTPPHLGVRGVSQGSAPRPAHPASAAVTSTRSMVGDSEAMAPWPGPARAPPRGAGAKVPSRARGTGPLPRGRAPMREH